MIWDNENNRVIVSMGMGWDMGPPFWPYQAIYLFLSTLNLPAFVACIPILKLLNLRTLWLQYAVWFPATLVLWWWVGTRIDFGILGRWRFRSARAIGVAFVAASLSLFLLACNIGFDLFKWWQEYGDRSLYRVPVVVRTIGPICWYLIGTGGFLTAAARLFRLRQTPVTSDRPSYRLLVIVPGLATLYVLGLHRWDSSLNPPFNYDECAIDRLYGLGCIHGTVVDEGGRPISRIEVDLIPTHRTATACRSSALTEWTDEQGRYNLNRIDPGEYFLAANAFDSFGAPDAERPFATAYYPGAKGESQAAPITVVRSAPLRLSPLRLHRLELATIKIDILWANGTRPERSNIYFKNVLYPLHGGTAPQIDDGTGEFTLPTGFDYDAVASVQCDAGEKIESRESKPTQRVRVADGFTPARMTFVIPGPPCALWRPR